MCFLFFFFFQAEDGIRDVAVTGVQTCALPISAAVQEGAVATGEIGEAPSPAAMPELGVHRGDDAGPGTLQHNLALGAAAQSRDVPADFYCLPRGEVDQLEVRHEAPPQASARIRPWRADRKSVV